MSRAGGVARHTFVHLLVVVVLVLLTVLAVAAAGTQRAARAEGERGLEQASDLVAQLLAGRGRSLAGGARVFVQGPYFRTLVAERRRDDILDQTLEAAEQLEASWVFITDANGVLVAKSDEPSAAGDAMSGIPLVAGALRGQVTTGFGGSGDSLLFLATAVPIMAPGGTPFGVLVATSRLDSALAADMALATASNLVFYVRTPDGAVHVSASTMPLSAADRAALARRLSPAPDSVAESAMSAVTGATSEVRQREASQPAGTAASATRQPTVRAPGQRLVLRDSSWISYASALNTAGGAEVGGYLVLRAATGDQRGMASLRLALVIALLLGVMLAAGAALLMARRMADPLQEMTAAIHRFVAQGDWPAFTRRRESHTATAPRGEQQPAVAEVAALTDAIGVLARTLHDRAQLAELIAPVLAERETTGTPADSATPLLSRRSRRAEVALSLPMTPRGDSHLLQLEEGTWLAHRYRIEATRGGGATAVVYDATDRATGTRVALKMLRPELVPREPAVREALADALRRTRSVQHRQVARVIDVGDVQGTLFVTAELVDGVDLDDVMRRGGALAPAALDALARQLLAAVMAVHAAGVVHGDIKPTNIRITPAGDLKLTDLTLANLLARQGSGVRPRAATPEHGVLALDVTGRVVGAPVGSPAYLAPERLIGAPASVAADLFAVGVVLQEAWSGEAPRFADSPVDRLAGALRDSHEATVVADSAVSTAVTSRIATLITRLTAAEPGDRPDSAMSALALLDNESASSPPRE
jgi:serine/threonine-protein kinase